jgi:WhiB family redox-sensing transcriptional regulator
MAKTANLTRPSLRPRDSDADRLEAWRDAAACRDYDPELFFPIGRGMHAMYRADVAKGICATCPVQRECLEWVLGSPVALEGIWGGTTEDERAALIRTTKPTIRRHYQEER